ncbi:hypothetical protein [Streptomyces sp. NBC_00299]|uniref:hypothetical protein n=1 Tax=Streptomyces sp. NBC_00299 TaxID=2975705 RepID=UPI002E2D875C|nr:hypothetical protein [Streptomyces sp. NBC_00299]
MYVSPISPSIAAAPLTTYARFERPLLAFVNELLSPVDYQRGPQLALMAWAEALGSLEITTEAGMERDIPLWLADAVRRVVREQTSPAASVGRVVTVVTSDGEPHGLATAGSEAPAFDCIVALPLAS